MADDRRAVLVVLRVVCRVDCGVSLVCRRTERHGALSTADADATGAARYRAPVPRSLRAACGPNIDLIPGADDPHRHVSTQGAIAARGRQLQFLSVTDPLQLVVGPHRRHQSDPTRTSALIARRSSNGRLDILAANRLGYALYSEVFTNPARPANMARFTFLHARA